MKIEHIAKGNIRKTHLFNSQPAEQNIKNIDVMLQSILDKLDKMKERISNLEHRAQGAIPKVKNG